MGKKSRRTVAASATAADSGDDVPMDREGFRSQTTPSAVDYPSDGPSDVELLQTSSSSLQATLDELTRLGLADDREGFVRRFVPFDLSRGDADLFLEGLTTGPEAEGQWRNLVAEIAAIRSGRGVDRIEGDQVTRAVFFFTHPLLGQCDREVAFVMCSSSHGGGGGEWRAEG